MYIIIIIFITNTIIIATIIVINITIIIVITITIIIVYLCGVFVGTDCSIVCLFCLPTRCCSPEEQKYSLKVLYHFKERVRFIELHICAENVFFVGGNLSLFWHFVKNCEFQKRLIMSQTGDPSLRNKFIIEYVLEI